MKKSVLIPFWLTAAASVTAIQKKSFWSSITILLISTEEMDYVMKIVKSLKESSLLIKRISEWIKSKAKEQKGRFLDLLLGTLCASLSGNLVTGKWVIK